MDDRRFLAKYHVRRGADFKRAYDRKCAASDQVMLVFGVPNGLPYSRIGLSVSRKVGGAVLRNRWKRLIREAFRLRREALPTGLDLVIIPRRQPVSREVPELNALLSSLPRLAHRVNRKLQSGTPSS